MKSPRISRQTAFRCGIAVAVMAMLTASLTVAVPSRHNGDLAHQHKDQHKHQRHEARRAFHEMWTTSEQVASWASDLAIRLKLTPEQQEDFAALIETRSQVHDAAKNAMDHARAEFQALKQGGGPDSWTQEQREDAKMLRKETMMTMQDIKAYEKEVTAAAKSILTDRQLAQLDAYVAEVKPEVEAMMKATREQLKAEHGVDSHSPGERIFTMARETSDSRYERRRNFAFRMFARKHELSGEEAQATREAFFAVLDEARGMDDGTFEASRDDLVQKLMDIREGIINHTDRAIRGLLLHPSLLDDFAE